uniref:Capsid protein n=1 Tax=Human T-cell leukemia virus 2 TaxID=11909 RepID=Q9WS61_HTLV2|nr:capsid protein [Human T-lymphotropic virus 2]
MGQIHGLSPTPIPKAPRGLSTHHWLNFLQAAYRLQPGPSGFDFQQLRRFLKLSLKTPIWLNPIDYSLLASLIPKGYPGRVVEIIYILVKNQVSPSASPAPVPTPICPTRYHAMLSYLTSPWSPLRSQALADERLTGHQAGGQLLCPWQPPVHADPPAGGTTV